MTLITFVLSGCGDAADADVDGDSSSPETALIIGTDERTVAPSTAYPYRSVAALRWRPNDERASCSAFKVGPRHLVSAAHCFFTERENGSWGAITTENRARIVFGQRGSGNGAANMPVDGRKVQMEYFFVPSGYVDSHGDDLRFDWAVIRLADADSSSGWFKISSWSNEQLAAFEAPSAVGYPLHSESCAGSPLMNGDCGGFLYEAPVAQLLLSPSYLDVQTDWNPGQSGGPLFANLSDTRQKAALGIVVRHRHESTQNFARRFTPEIVSHVCQDIFDHPSTTHAHECEKSPTALQ